MKESRIGFTKVMIFKVIQTTTSNSSSKDMDPSLYRAAMEGNAGEILVQKQQELVHQVTPNNSTVLHVAALFGKAKCVKDILRLCPSLHCQVNSKRETPLHIAAKEGHIEVAVILIECAKEFEKEIESGVHLLLTKEMLRMTDKDEDTALHKAVRYHHCALAKLLVEEDPEFSFPVNKTGETPVYLAAEGGLEICLSSILNSCASPAYGGPCARTALHAAVIFNLQGCIKILLDWKKTLCEEADMYGWTPLHYAALFGHIEGVQQILNVNKSVAYFTIDKEEATALHIAASQGYKDIVKVLLSHCPDCWEMVNVRSQNILHIAVIHEKKNVINYILNSSMLSKLIGEKDIDGNTPLHLLAASGCFMPRLIYHHRADKMAFNNENMTPLDIAYSDKYTSNWGVIRRTLRTMGGHFGLRDVVRDSDAIATEEKACDEDQMVIQEMRKEADTSLIVAALIATVTFAAGFTLPGGYFDSDEGLNQGMAILARKAAFKAFVIIDTIALTCSSCAVFVYFMKADYVNKHKLIRHYTIAKSLITIAMGALVLAFITGLFVVLAHSSGLAASVIVIGICTFLGYYYELRPALRSIRGRPRYLYSEQTRMRGRPTYMLWGDKSPPQKFVML